MTLSFEAATVAAKAQLANGTGANGATEAPRTLKIEFFDAIKAPIDSGDFIEGVLCSGALSVLYGEAGCGKSHLAVDLTFHVATGRPWFGREVDQCGVLYIAAEGGAGIRKRIAALRQHYTVADPDVPLAVIMQPLDLQGDIDALEATVLQLRDCLPGGIGLIIIDTLSRALSGGDENSSADMGGFVRSIDRLRLTSGAHVMVVHHSGKDASRGARGHSLIRAAVDTEIEVIRDANSRVATASVTKQRDMECDGEFSFVLKTIELGTDRRGKPITSCVVDPVDSGTYASPKPRLTGAAKIAYERLCKALDEHGEIPAYSVHIPENWRAVRLEHWRKIFYAGTPSGDGTPETSREAKKKAFQRAIRSLQATGAIQIHDDWIWSTSRKTP
jgi:hypothetical protein